MFFQITTFLLLSTSLARAAYAPIRRDGGNRAAYFLDNDEAGNQLISLKIDHNGALSSPVRTATGGNGLTGLLAVSQDSVVVGDNVWHSHP